MKRVKTEFICDSCGKEKSEAPGLPVYPYVDGWNYLYSVNLQLGNPQNLKRIDEKDKHFCSAGCLLAFIAKKIQESG